MVLQNHSMSLFSTDKRVKLSTITEKIVSLQTSVIFVLEEFCHLNYHCEVSFLWEAASIQVSVLRRSRGAASNLRRSMWSQQRNSPAGPARPPLCFFRPSVTPAPGPCSRPWWMIHRQQKELTHRSISAPCFQSGRKANALPPDHLPSYSPAEYAKEGETLLECIELEP